MLFRSKIKTTGCTEKNTNTKKPLHIKAERGKGKKLSLIKAAALKKKAKTYFDNVVEKYGAISDELNKDDNTEERKSYLRGVKKLLQDAQTDLRRDINVL